MATPSHFVWPRGGGSGRAHRFSTIDRVSPRRLCRDCAAIVRRMCGARRHVCGRRSGLCRPGCLGRRTGAVPTFQSALSPSLASRSTPDPMGQQGSTARVNSRRAENRPGDCQSAANRGRTSVETARLNGSSRRRRVNIHLCCKGRRLSEHGHKPHACPVFIDRTDTVSECETEDADIRPAASERTRDGRRRAAVAVIGGFERVPLSLSPVPSRSSRQSLGVSRSSSQHQLAALGTQGRMFVDRPLTGCVSHRRRCCCRPMAATRAQMDRS